MMMWEIQRRIRECTQLAENWDSYGGKPTTPVAAKRTLQFLNVAKGEPGISPTVEGGISCEWRHGHVTLIVEFDPTGLPSAYYCDEAAKEEYELAVTQ